MISIEQYRIRIGSYNPSSVRIRYAGKCKNNFKRDKKFHNLWRILFTLLITVSIMGMLSGNVAFVSLDGSDTVRNGSHSYVQWNKLMHIYYGNIKNTVCCVE